MERNASTKKSLNEAINAGRVDIEGGPGKKERGIEPGSAELP